MNGTLLLICYITLYQAQRYLLPNGTIWSLFKHVQKNTPSIIPFELEHSEQEAFFNKPTLNTIKNPYKPSVLWYNILFP